MLTLVCLTCGKERYYTDQPPGAVTCERCGGTVFRSFFTPTSPDPATEAALEDSARSVAMDEESPDTEPGDLEDLNRP